jgi:ribosomal protein S12 methylthiotransferase accessory factor
MQRPVLKPKYHVETVPGEGCFLLSETEAHVVEGPHVPYILPLLQQGLSTEEIIESTRAALTPEETRTALDALWQAGHLTEADPAMPAPLAAYWSELDLDSAQARAALEGATVGIDVLGPVDPRPFVAALADFGVRTDAAGAPRVVLTDDYLNPGLARINSACLLSGTPYLLVKPVGLRLWVGPLVLPGYSACWQCMASRLAENREAEGYVRRRLGRPGPLPVVRARTSLGEMQAHAMAAAQMVRFLVTGTHPSLENRVLVADLASFTFDFHTVTRRPQCTVCGDPRRAENIRPFVLAPHRSTDEGGGYRAEPPEQTYARYQHLISPLTGVVSEVVPSAWHGAGPLRVYVAGHNFALKNDSLSFLKDGLRSRSSGKGRTDAQARTSALCEALERCSGLHRGDEPRITAALTDMSDSAVDPRLSMLFSERQYRERAAWLAKGSRFQVVPQPFDEEAEIDWSPVWSLTHGGRRYLPTGYLYYNYPSRQDQFFYWADSNGAAAGVTPTEAALQGLLEVIERDAVALWWYNRVQRPAVDLSSLNDGYYDELRAFYASHGREFWVLDITTDVGVPAYVSVNRRVTGPTEDILFGFGAHVDARVAVNRAVTEMNQFMPAVLTTAPDGSTLFGVHDAEAVRWWRTATLSSEPYLAADSCIEAPRGGRSHSDLDVAAAIRDIVATLAGLGLETLVLDQTRPDIGLPVVKVIVPGMRHFWARFAPGRLYEVPVRLGWLKSATPETRLNPTPMFL